MSAALEPPPSAASRTPEAPAEEAFAHCAGLVRANARNFYYAFRLLPRARREAMYALYAFCRVADDIVDEPGDDPAKREGLCALRQGLAEAFGGAPRGPMLTALAAVKARYGLSESHLVAVIDGCAMDLERSRYASWDELALYLDRVASAVGRSTMEVFDLDPDARAAYGRAGGFSVQMTNILRDVREDLERDRIYLPGEDLERFGVSEDDLRAGRMTKGFKALMAFEVGRTRALYREARGALPQRERRRLLPLTAICRIYERVLDRIEASGYDVFSERASIPGWKKAWIGLDTWLKARLGLPIGR